MMGEIRRGSGAEAAISTGIKVADVRDGLQNGPFNWKGLVVQALPPEMKQEAEAVGQPSHRSTEAAPYAEALGCAVVKAAASKHWGVAKALLQELSWSSEPARQKALAKADATRKTALRMCVDGLARDSKQLLQALEGATLRLILGSSRQYWWCFHVRTVCCNTLWLNGHMSIGIPRSQGCGPQLGDVVAKTPLAALSGPVWRNCVWSEPQECDGQLEDLTGEEPYMLRLKVDDGHGTVLKLRRVDVGEVVMFGHSRVRNPLGHSMLAATGTVAGRVASGLFDPTTCARWAAEMNTSGPRPVARLALELGADPRALSDDGLSPYTAAILREDPCGMLKGLNAQLRFRILRGDETAWAEVARSAEGRDLPDIAAGALSRGLPIPKKMAEELLEYCFSADLPLLALRVLARIDGKRFLMPALERAGTQTWRRVAERIVEQIKPGQKPYWLNPPALKCAATSFSRRYAIHEIQRGRSQYRIMLQSFLAFLKSNEEKEFLAAPCVLANRRGGAECPICLEPLCRSTPTAFVADTAVCLHFLCSTCARGYASSTSSQGEALRCPECRRHAVEMRPVPSLCEDPLSCFEFLAANEDHLAQPMLLRTLSSLLPLESDALEAQGEALEQEVHAADFLTNGLFVWVWRHVQEHQRCMTLGPVPDLEERRAWFKYWNLSGSGQLSRSEVLRAILRSFRVTSLEKQKVKDLQSRVDKVWEMWSQQCTHGRSVDYVECEEFCMESGFGELLEEVFGSDPEGGASPWHKSLYAEKETTSIPPDGCLAAVLRTALLRGARRRTRVPCEGNDLHPTLKEVAPRLRAGLPRGRHPGLGRLQYRLQPRPKAAPSSSSEPPPDLVVPSEMLAPPIPEVPWFRDFRDVPEEGTSALWAAAGIPFFPHQGEVDDRPPVVGIYAWESDTESSSQEEEEEEEEEEDEVDEDAEEVEEWEEEEEEEEETESDEIQDAEAVLEPHQGGVSCPVPQEREQYEPVRLAPASASVVSI
ncbi:unnamed protein product [Durusdinium trenchii]|uniref:RING-type domain-containing protein n=1 Tax=Durusdinium trenchii TaxID=1381693 RepID=A0ABP0NG77_9DINO